MFNLQVYAVKLQQYEDLKSGLQMMLQRFVSAVSSGEFGAASMYMTKVMDSIPEPPVEQEGGGEDDP